MNVVVSVGNLTDDPKVAYTQSGMARAEFTLALNRMKEGADFPRYVAFDKRAELIEKYCHKGMKLAVRGHIQTGSYEGKNGKVYTTDIIVDEITFCEKRQQEASREDQPQVDPETDFMSIPDGLQEELPFH